jgi:hypothetical protein
LFTYNTLHGRFLIHSLIIPNVRIYSLMMTEKSGFWLVKLTLPKQDLRNSENKCGFSVKITTSMLLTRKLPTDEQWQMNAILFRKSKRPLTIEMQKLCIGPGLISLRFCAQCKHR